MALLEEACHIPGKPDGPSLAIANDLRKSTAAWALSRDCHYGFDPGGVPGVGGVEAGKDLEDLGLQKAGSLGFHIHG